MGIVWGAEGEQWLNPVQQARGTELLFILWRAHDGAWHWTQTRQAAKGPPHIPKYACVRTCLCMAMCASAVLEPQDAHPPISRNRAEHEMLGERWDPAASVAGLRRLSEGMWGAAALDDNVLLKIPEAEPGGVLPSWQRVRWLCGNRSLGCVQALLSWNHWGLNQYCTSQSSFDIRTFGGGLVFCTAAWVAASM